MTMARPPDDAHEIFVVGKQWMWKLQHLEGRREINELHVPVGQPVKLTMTSEDVIHSFYIPAFRIKADVVPGRYSTTWFEATKVGTYHLFCAEYCGTQHSQHDRTDRRHGTIRLPGLARRRSRDLRQRRDAAGRRGRSPLAEVGGANCSRRRVVSPAIRARQASWDRRCAGSSGSSERLTDGSSAVADDTYVRESILAPQSKIVAGYHPIMPTFQGQIDEEGLLALIQYIKSLAGSDDNQRGMRDGRTARRHGEDQWKPPQSESNYLNADYGDPFVAADARPQADRHSLPDLDHADLSPRQHVRRADPTRVADAGGRPRPGRHLQQAVHHARHRHDLLLPDPVDSSRDGQLPRADDDRRPRPGLPAPQSAELVRLRGRCDLHAVGDRHRRRRYRLDLLHSVQHHGIAHERSHHRGRHLHHRLFLDPHRAQLHRHDPHACAPRA